MANIEAILNVAAVNGSGVLCRGTAMSAQPVQAVVDAAARQADDLAWLQIEPRTQMLLLDALRVMTSGSMTLMDVRFGCMGSGSQLSLMDVRFGCMKSNEMVLFSPYHSMWTPAEAVLSATPRWTTDLPVEATIRDVWTINEIRLSACGRWTVDLEAKIRRLEAAVNVSAVAASKVGIPVNAAMNHPWVNAYGIVQTTLDFPVSVKPSGGVTDLPTRLIPTWRNDLRVSGYSVGVPSAELRIKPRVTDVVEAELRVEVV